MKDIPQDHLMLFGNCIPVRGAMRTAVCDLQRGNCILIPNHYAEFIPGQAGIPIAQLLNQGDQERNEIAQAVMDLLLAEKVAFVTPFPERFPQIPLKWENPSRITNCILDVDENSSYLSTELFEELEELGVNAVQFRLFHSRPPSFFENIAQQLSTSRIKSVEWVVPYASNLETDFWESLLRINPRCMSVVVHTSPRTEAVSRQRGKLKIQYLAESIHSESHCGHVHPSDFAVNIAAFTEAIHHNSCLNRKLGIDKHGQIKNCPSLETVYGQVGATKLKEIVSTERFQAIGQITKDQVTTCQDCEFRYVCTDCRAYADGNLGKPLKCGYDPYTMKWVD